MNVDKVLSRASLDSLGCIGYWPLNGNANDYSIIDNAGSLTNITFDKGLDGDKYANFGSSAKISMSTQSEYQITSVSDCIAFAIWLNPSNVSSDQYFVYKNYNSIGYTEWCLYLVSANSYELGLHVYGTASYVVLCGVPTVGEWIHIVGVANNGVLKIYKNGELANTSTFSSVRYGDYPLQLSGNSVGTNYVASGTLMSDFFYFTEEPTAQQVRQLYNATYIE